ncbi:hypothetical protein PsorP6_016285 [Peronosclerospora sorghi]|uniref:Uncharacterized protein n=1 Tax=Peronosclerospora sorghi TaxID=230839 RepID=A0ACC0VML1_9STRA|nr:hypothetical protein PsorP6_016285 [Peronosclerospora sorghi]
MVLRYWMFSIKCDAAGNIQRYKARLVAQGFRHMYVLIFGRLSSLNWARAFLALCCSRGYVIRQLDVETDFLNGNRKENVYMCPHQIVFN